MEFCDFDYVDEFEGYTREQRDLQEDRWLMMANGYSEAGIEEVYMNEELINCPYWKPVKNHLSHIILIMDNYIEDFHYYHH